LTPVAYFALIIVTILAVVALDQVPLVQDAITKSGFSSAEVWAGIVSILVIFYTVLFVFTVRS
jgi:hypothetical protein